MATVLVHEAVQISAEETNCEFQKTQDRHQKGKEWQNDCVGTLEGTLIRVLHKFHRLFVDWKMVQLKTFLAEDGWTGPCSYCCISRWVWAKNFSALQNDQGLVVVWNAYDNHA